VIIPVIEIAVIMVPIITVHRTQVFLVDFAADSPAQARPCRLVCPKMNPAVNASAGEFGRLRLVTMSRLLSRDCPQSVVVGDWNWSSSRVSSY
jgi:hypothetical protein